MRTRTRIANWSALTLAAIVAVGATVGVAPAVAASCPTTNPPDQMVVGAGTPQTTKTTTPFATDLAVVLQSSSGCPVTSNAGGVSVTFTAPSGGATGTFSSTGTTTATVGTTSSGVATAPTLTANDVAGTFTVVATSVYG